MSSPALARAATYARPELEHPPSAPVWWLCRVKGDPSRTTKVVAQTWSRACELGRRALDCLIEEVEAEREAS
jgi:hypothetical protein